MRIFHLTCWLMALTGILPAQPMTGQLLPFRDLSAFENPASNWSVVGEVQADFDKAHDMNSQSGTGILLNQGKPGQGEDLYTTWEHGDMDLSFDFMMPKQGNSGIYLMGRYEIQLADSWRNQRPSFADCGGVYERWDNKKPAGMRGYQGYAPRQQAARAPGLWQHMDISFQAPRFDAEGRKIAAAKLLMVKLNGVIIHENLILDGPTRGADAETEVAQAALRIQGDHGPVAICNMRYELFGDQTIETGPYQYDVYLGELDGMPDFTQLEPDRSGETEFLTQEVAGETEKFLLRLSGAIKVPQAGQYDFLLNSLGVGTISIDGQLLAEPRMWNQMISTELEQGTHQIEIYYYKPANWYPNGLSLSVSGPGMRPQALHRLSSMPLETTSAIHLIDVGSKPEIMRCFIDYQESDISERKRIVHAINVGIPDGPAFTYDPDRATIVQAWRGDFLHASSMWDNRGDGSSVPRGSVLPLGATAGIADAEGQTEGWPEMPPETLGLRFSGYEINQNDMPIFQYQLGETHIQDHIHSKDNASLTRHIRCSDAPSQTLDIRLAQGQSIEATGKKRYCIDQTYYIDLLGKSQAEIRNIGDQQLLLMPLKGVSEASYRILW